ncbi:hypothetical protein D3C85_892040 [compost metagenome]
MSVQGQSALRLAHLGQDSEHLAFQLLHHAHGDIEEVAGAAGRVQHTDAAQVAVKIPHHAARPPLIARHIEADGAGLDGLPVRTQGFHDRRLDQAFDIGARGVVGAQFRALVRGESLFQQSPEDGRLHRGPVPPRRRNQGLQFVLGDRQGRSVAKQPAVEPAQGLANGRAMPALVHTPEEVARAQMKLVGVTAIAFQKAAKAPVLDQADTVGEHGEDALHDEQGRLIGPRRLGHRIGSSVHAERHAPADGADQPGQARGDVGRHLGHARGGVQAHRIGPDPPQPIPHRLVAQVRHLDTIAGAVGERRIGLALPPEVRPQLDGPAYVHNDDEGRPLVQGLGVVLGLTLGVAHEGFERAGRRRDLASLAAEQGQLRLRVQRPARPALARLLGLQNKGAAPVAVDVARMAAAVLVQELHRALEAVVEVARPLVIGRRHPDQPTQLADEGLVVGALADRRLRPAANEVVCIHGLSASPPTTLD